jgi:hypothetical protein
MNIRIQVTRDEFALAESNGWVDGLYQGKQGIYVYVELGQEEEYIPRSSDDLRTEYRAFRNCNIFFAASREQLDAADFSGEKLNVTVIIYC